MSNVSEEKKKNNNCCCCGDTIQQDNKKLDCYSADFEEEFDGDDLDMCCDIFSYERPTENNAKKTKRKTCC